jgi:dephospho-CoA kinase
LLRDRAMTEESIRARIAAQAPLEDKLAVADVVVDNDGSLEELEEQVGRVWDDLRMRAAAARA